MPRNDRREGEAASSSRPRRGSACAGSSSLPGPAAGERPDGPRRPIVYCSFCGLFLGVYPDFCEDGEAERAPGFKAPRTVG